MPIIKGQEVSMTAGDLMVAILISAFAGATGGFLVLIELNKISLGTYLIKLLKVLVFALILSLLSAWFLFGFKRIKRKKNK